VRSGSAALRLGIGEFGMPVFSGLTLRTARLDLRPLAPADARALFALKSDPLVQRYGSHVPWTELQQAVDYLERDRRSLAEGRHVQFAVTRRDDGAMLGTCTLYELDEQCRRAELGYALLPSAWGRGYANEAVTSLLDWGFGHLGLNRVEADIDPRNTASARALERLGFTREGHLRERWIVGGEKCDSFMYGLLAAEWQARP
jgi:RimJ/RimL family protein N-acetyltransferase